MSNVLYDEITINRIKLLHPNIRNQVKEWYFEINKQLPKGVRLRFTHTYRSVEEQNKLFAQRPKVTNAKGGQSIHNYGLAWDIVILKQDEKGNWLPDWNVDLYWYQVAGFFKRKGVVWGGDWKSFKDNPHFELSFGRNWQFYQSQPTITDNGIKYPKLY